ncbi:MAG: aminotransferase class V-fold PLP-dependent enzyme [Armatimonadetes bacterium]|nr:aminotransferase class V-fold PLP-dependent enzyme [Armatimonadota bacterium]
MATQASGFPREGVVYMDNAATSFPKAPGVAEAVAANLSTMAGSAGRAAHTFAAEALELVWSVRRELSALFHTAEPTRWALMFNATDAINTALKGFLRAGDHVIVSSLEHNAVARPLRYLQRTLGINISFLPYVPGVGADPADVPRLVRPNTRLLVCLHASNVTGEILPIRELAAAAHECDIPVLVDAAQTAGSIEIDADGWGIDMLAITGHKGLLGPAGTGALYVRPGLNVEALRHGGTGSFSEMDVQPEQWPDHLESGTMNMPGLAGLLVALKWLSGRGVTAIRQHELDIMGQLLDGFSETAGVEIYGPRRAQDRVGLVSINVGAEDPAFVAEELERRAILTRAGLHCAPWAHRCLGTLNRGTVRLSVGPFTTRDDVERVVKAVAEIARTAIR